MALKTSINQLLSYIQTEFNYFSFKLMQKLRPKMVKKINLCCGHQSVPNYFGIDICRGADLRIDLSRRNLPFKDDSIDSVICISSINYFSYQRALGLIKEVVRILKPGGIARFGTQDLRMIAKRYVEEDHNFFYQKNPDGCDRFEGKTIGDKFVAWLYGYEIAGTPCRYFYDYDSLAYLFKEAGFKVVTCKRYQESKLPDILVIDNRSDQMFFLEAEKS